MNHRLRQERTVFLLFLGALFVSLMSALPILTATLPAARFVQTQAASAAGASGPATFEQLDRNHDGYVDRAEAAALPGLERVFNRADRRPDGRLDKVEYAQALALMDSRP